MKRVQIEIIAGEVSDDERKKLVDAFLPSLAFHGFSYRYHDLIGEERRESLAKDDSLPLIEIAVSRA